MDFFLITNVPFAAKEIILRWICFVEITRRLTQQVGAVLSQLKEGRSTVGGRDQAASRPGKEN